LKIDKQADCQASRLPLVQYRKRNLRAGRDATKGQFPKQSPLIDFLTRSVRESKLSAFIGGKYSCAYLNQYVSKLLLAAGERRYFYWLIFAGP
jgi:hypothetical protein